MNILLFFDPFIGPKSSDCRSWHWLNTEAFGGSRRDRAASLWDPFFTTNSLGFLEVDGGLMPDIAVEPTVVVSGFGRRGTDR